MARYLLEVTHPADPAACTLAIKTLLESGSHYLTRADFGCMDDEHKAWIVVEADNKEEACFILPPVYRSAVHIVELAKFPLQDVEEMMRQHERPAG